MGRAGFRTSAEEEEIKNGIMVHGLSEVGTYAKHGGYRGTGEAMVAVLFLEKDEQLVQFIADQEFQDTTVFYRIIKSLRFR